MATFESESVTSNDPPIGDIGRRLREARQGRFTVRELAAAAGVSAGSISEIERGRGNPSFQTLFRVSQALGLQVGDLIGAYDQGPDRPAHDAVVVRRSRRKRLQMGEDGLVHELLTPNLQRDLEMLLTVVPGGFDNQDDVFNHVGEECVLVLEGTLEVSVGGELFALETGDAITYDSGIDHWWRNASDVDARVVGAVTPASF